MLKTLVFGSFLLFAANCHADKFADTLHRIESDWATIYYATPVQQKPEQYIRLLKTIRQLVADYPEQAEPLIWQANLTATYAEHQSSFEALEAIHRTRDLLLKAISIDPAAMEGAAYVTLGSLYYMAPGWPIAFGNDEKAERFLQTALAINPQGIDSNYFYGDFLLSTGKDKQAEAFFRKALAAPTRPEQLFADIHMKAEASMGLENARARKISGIKGLFSNLFSTVRAKQVRHLKSDRALKPPS